MSKKKKMLALMLSGVLCFAVGCSRKNKNPAEPGPEPEQPITVSKTFDNFEKDQVYFYESHDKAQSLHFQGMNYMLEMQGSEGDITGVQVIDYPERKFVAQNFDQIAESSISLYYKNGDVVSKATGIQPIQNSKGASSGRYWRMIESGRYSHKIDLLKLVYDRAENAYGRLEVKAMRECFALTYELYVASRVAAAELYFDFIPSAYKTYSTEENGRAVILSDGNGNGLAFILPADGSVTAEKRAAGIRISANSMEVVARNYTGFGVLCVPFANNDLSGVREAVARDSVSISVQATSPEQSAAPTRYNSSTGEFLIDGNIITSTNYYNYSVESNRNLYDIYRIKFNNPTDKPVKVPFAVLKNTSALRECDRAFPTAANFGMSGMTPMLCDTDGNPMGIAVQICKNWHSYDNAAVEDVTKSYTGQWFVGTTEVTVPANSEYEFDYKISYENWGTAANVSHSQLSLIGWDMYTLWEQLALGSHGENICFYNYGTYDSAWMQDIRPYLVTNSHGLNQQYNWSGNTGGGELLRYTDNKYKDRNIDEMYTDFVAQGPNMSDIVYGGLTSDGKIKMDFRTNLLRSDDVTRVLFNIDYTFTEDTEFSRMTFFQYGSERYQANYFQKYAFGNSNEIIESGEIPAGEFEFLNSSTEQKKSITGDNPWFMVHDFRGTSRTENNGMMFTVRRYDADLNGTKYDSPTFNMRKLRTGPEKQIGFELTAPSEVGKKIDKGSKVSMTIELCVLPQDTDTWYGKSDYLTATSDLFNTPEQGLQQAKYGSIEVAANVGEVTSSYPVMIKTVNEDTAAQFTLRGGLGYVPVQFTGLKSYKGYKLQVQKNGEWEDVDQSVKGNDFWQCDYDYATKTYTRTYNVKNVAADTLGGTNTYRLLKTA